MGAGKFVAIGTGVAALIGVLYVSSTQGFSLENLRPIDMTQSFTQQTREPIRVYENCATILGGSKTTVKCDTGPGIDPQFEFFTPDALKDMVIWTEKSRLYQYGDNDFELVLFDQVGEKRYPVRLYELPT